MANHSPGSREWLDQVQEDIIDPEREIVDPHHHLWRGGRWFDYMLEDLWADTGSGHNVKKTVFVQCRSSYRTEGPEHLKSVGETEFVAKIAAESRKGPENQAKIAGIVAHADLTQGDWQSQQRLHVFFACQNISSSLQLREATKIRSPG